MSIFDCLPEGYLALFLTIVHERYIDPETAFSLLRGNGSSTKVTAESMVALKELGMSSVEIAKEIYPQCRGNSRKTGAYSQQVRRLIEQHKKNKLKYISRADRRMPRKPLIGGC